MAGKLRGCTYLYLWAIVMMCAGVANAELRNGDFEISANAGTEPQGWIIRQGKLLTDSKIRSAGQYAGKLDGGDGPAVAFQDVEVTPGKAYSFGGQWRNGDKTAEFDVVAASITFLDKVGGTERGVASTQDSGPVVSTWKPFELTPVIIPGEVYAVRITLKSRFGIGAFDALSLHELDVTTAQAAIASATQNKSGRTLSGRIAGGGSAGMETAPSAGAVATRWYSDLEAARQAAAAQGMPILVFFSDPEAEVSQHLETQVFSNSIVRGALERYIAVNLPFAQHRELAYKLQVFRAGVVVTYDPQGRFKSILQDTIPADQFATKLLAN